MPPAISNNFFRAIRLCMVSDIVRYVMLNFKYKFKKQIPRVEVEKVMHSEREVQECDARKV